MIDHLLFNRSSWIEKTNEVQTKLSEYDKLKAFHDKVMSYNHQQITTDGSPVDKMEYNYTENTMWHTATAYRPYYVISENGTVSATSNDVKKPE